MKNLAFGIGRRAPRRRQRGITLVVALVFMVALTLLGVGMVRSTSSDERIGANSRDRDIAFAAAEAAIRDAEIRILGASPSSPTALDYRTFPPVGTCSNGLCAFGFKNTVSILQNSTYQNFAGTAASQLGYLTNSPAIDIQGVTTTGSNANVQQPMYYIELAKKPKYNSQRSQDDYFYRITAIGYGARNSTQVILQEGFLLP